MTGGRRITFRVGELNEAVKQLLESDLRFLDLCVTGELSNYKIYPSGHHYFTLKDRESSLRCVMFRSSAQRLRFRPENGMQVSAIGSLRVYSRDGVYQLSCTAILPEGVGDLQMAFEQLKKKLDTEGLFDPSRKKKLPEFPECIALITSSAGAAIHDMIRIYGRRWPMTKLLLLPVRVQGVEAPEEIVGAIRFANEQKLADLIVTGRGGGSLEDLWAFNDERVARAIAASEIPVISAVGHEPDVTISDYVADRRASTPSNAAEISVPDQTEVRDALRSLKLRLNKATEKKAEHSRQRLQDIKNRRVLRDAGGILDPRRLETDRLRELLSVQMRQQLLHQRNRLVRDAAALDAMSPLKVLSRGYLIASDPEGIPVSSVEALYPGERITLRLKDGRANCTVNQLEVN